MYSASLKVCFLLFESKREHLKFQLEVSLLRCNHIVFGIGRFKHLSGLIHGSVFLPHSV